MKKVKAPGLMATPIKAAVVAALSLSSFSAGAVNLMSENGTEVNFDLEVILGHFSSSERYNQLHSEAGDATWQEGYAKYGFSGSKALSGTSSIFGAVNLMSTMTSGDGDAAGFSTGDESETEIEDAYIGFDTGNGIKFSFGRQPFVVGDGFVINGDALNFGEGFDPSNGGPAPRSFSRGGAYWLAARKAYDKTAILSLGKEEGPRGDIFWLESDNPAYSMMELGGINLEYNTAAGTLGLMHLKGLGVDEEVAGFFGNQYRDGQKTTSIRGQGNAGVENLFLSFEYVDQDNGAAGDANASYVEAGWTFADTKWSPSINYRLSQFDTGYDPLFFGFNRGYGTWFQGEVAANYAGPFSTDTDIHYVGLKAQPSETLTVGAAYFDFDDAAGGNLDATELNIWAEWVAMNHLIISPLVGLYTPDNSAEEGGSQLGSDDTNNYFQVLAIIPY